MSNLDGSDSAISSGIGTAQTPITGNDSTEDIPALLTVGMGATSSSSTNSLISNDASNSSSNPILVEANRARDSESNTNTSLGFCHSCNKQAQIDIEAFTCTECNGGFIELLSNNSDTLPSSAAANTGNRDSRDFPSGSTSTNVSNLSSDIRPIDRLIDSRPIEISDDEELDSGSNGANNPSPFFVINSAQDTSSNHSTNSNSGSGANRQGDTFSTVTTPLFQLIRRLNNRRARVANIINSQLQQQQTQASDVTANTGASNAGVGGSNATQEGLTTPVITLEGDSDASSEWPPPSSNQTEPSNREMADSINTGVIFNPFNSFSRARTSSFHYRLRRHGAYSGPSGLSSSREPGQESRRIPIHRHRFHRSPQASRFHFNFLDDDELLNDHGAIIITTLINQLRNTNRGAAPASDVQIKNLPLVDMDKEQIEKISQCAVCMEDFALLEKVKQLPCKHLYHDPCIDQWLKLHATCPVCRKNISEDDPAAGGESPDQPTLESTRPTLLNIFPFSASSASPLDSANLSSNISSSHTTDSQISAAQSALNNSSTRRQNIRNRQLYRVQIRQAASQSQDNNLSSSSSSSIASSNGNSDSTTATDEPPVQSHQRQWFDRATLRRNRMYDTIASSMSIQERQPGVRATAVLINPRWNRSTTQTTNSTGQDNATEGPAESPANGIATSATSESSPLSAFSLMSDYRNFRSSQASPASANGITNGSRISQMVDRLLNHYRTTRFSNGTAHRSSPYGSIDTSNPAQRFSLHGRSVNTTSNPSPQRAHDSSSGPSISLRLGQLFRSNRNRNINGTANNNNNSISNPSNTNTNSDSNSSNSQTNETLTSAVTTSSTGTTEAATGGNQGNTSNSSSDFFEIFQLEPSSLDNGSERASFGPGNRTSLRLPSSQRLRREDQSQGLFDDNDSFTENPNNYFDFSLFNRSQTLENNLLLDRLFDIPEDVQQITSDELDEHILGLAEEEDEDEDDGEDGDGEDTSSQDDDVPDLISADEPITIRLNDSDFERHQYSASGTSRAEQTRTLSDMEASDLASGGATAVVSQAKKRKTESA